MDQEETELYKSATAESEIETKLLTYGEDQLTGKFPNCIDGLKTSTRRIAWCSQAHTEPIEFTRLVADVSKLHVGGDTAIIETIIRLSQPFMTGHNLIEVEGKSGEYYAPKAYAAPRYLKAAISEFSKDVYFNKVNLKTLPITTSKDFRDTEPRYLIPRLPMALILGNLSVGYAFKSKIPMVSLGDVCDAVTAYADFYLNRGMGIPANYVLAKHLVPSFPIPCLIKNREELIEHYSQGDYDCPIEMEGTCELTNSTIILRSIPYGSDFNGTVQRMRTALKSMENKKKQSPIDASICALVDTVNDLSSDKAEFAITLKRGVNPFEALEKLQGPLTYCDSLHPLWNYLSDSRITKYQPPIILLKWYRERANSIRGALKYQQAALILKQLELQALKLVAGHTDEVIKIIRSADTEDVAIENLYKRFPKLTLNQARIIEKLPLGALTRMTRSRVESELEQVATDLENNIAAFGKIHETIKSDAAYFKKRWDKPKLTRYSDEFMGYIQFGNLGITHFFDKDDLLDLISSKSWPDRLQRTVYFYDKSSPNRYAVRRGMLLPADKLGRHVWCEKVLCFPKVRDEYTLAIGKDKTARIMRTALPEDMRNGNYDFYPISKTFYGIERDGKVVEETIDKYPLKDGVGRGAKTKLIYAWPDKLKNLVVVHMNPTQPNILRLDRVVTEEELGKLRLAPNGKTNILGIYPFTSKDVWLNIPCDCRKGTSMEFLVVRHLDKLFAEGPHQFIDINKSNKALKLTRNSRARALFTLEL